MLKLEKETIVVCLAGDKVYEVNRSNRPEGFITWANPKGAYISYGPLKDLGSSPETNQDCFRLATEKEIRAYKNGIRFVKDIPKDEIINEYSIY